jgi:MutS-like protein
VSDPSTEYSKRLENKQRLIAAKNAIHFRVGYWKLATIAAGLVMLWATLARHLFTPYFLFAPAAIYLVLALFHEKTIRDRTHAETAAAFYQRGIARIEDRWPGTGETGERFRDPKHIYAEDLDLFVRGGLFQLLSTARLPMGENRLAQWLLVPSPVAEIVERHELVGSLREKLDLREDLAVTGEDLRAGLKLESLAEWSETPSTLPSGAMRAVAVLLAICAAAALWYSFAKSNYFPVLIVVLVEAGVTRWLWTRANEVVSSLTGNAEGLILFSKVLQRLEDEQYSSPRLQNHIAKLKTHGDSASRALLRLARIVNWTNGRESLLGKLAELPFLYTIQSGLAAEAWRRRWGGQMRHWIEVVSEMEALLSLASYSYEHPADPFPEFIQQENSKASFDGAELGHPLIPSAKCVRNSIRLDQTQRLVLISGSNMSGKSTFLRTVGINTVLAMAGAPVRAKSLRLTPLAIGTRIRSTDSLQEGRSSFFTEILQIRQVFELTHAPMPLLFLFDELLEGTNSNDRRIGSEGLLRALLNHGAIGIVTTHDLALTEVADPLGGEVRNKHFQDHVEDGKMRFDYKLQDGIVAKSNALALMRLIGLDV